MLTKMEAMPEKLGTYIGEYERGVPLFFAAILDGWVGFEVLLWRRVRYWLGLLARGYGERADLGLGITVRFGKFSCVRSGTDYDMVSW